MPDNIIPLPPQSQPPSSQGWETDCPWHDIHRIANALREHRAEGAEAVLGAMFDALKRLSTEGDEASEAVKALLLEIERALLGW